MVQPGGCILTRLMTQTNRTIKKETSWERVAVSAFRSPYQIPWMFVSSRKAISQTQDGLAHAAQITTWAKDISSKVSMLTQMETLISLVQFTTATSTGQFSTLVPTMWCTKNQSSYSLMVIQVWICQTKLWQISSLFEILFEKSEIHYQIVKLLKYTK